MKSKRIDEIKQYIYDNKTVTLEQLCTEFGISMSTIRRDLDEILKQPDIKKVYGGLSVLPKKDQTSFETRNSANADAKRRIAAAAAAFVDDGDTIFVDSGTTTMYMIDCLGEKKDITVITNNFELIQRSIPYGNVNIISLPGIFNRDTLSFTGLDTERGLKNFNVSKAFMASTGFSTTCGVTNAFPAESELKRTAVQRCRKVFLLADSSKCDVAALITYCELSSIHVLITDKNPTKEIVTYMQKSGNEIVVAE
jgi:DeoR family myo-inositol catabolism operon transcriptional repressor